MAQRKTSRKTQGTARPSRQSAKPAGQSRKLRTTASKRSGSAESTSIGDQEVSIDRRRAANRLSEARSTAEQPQPAAPKLERRKKVNRRRQIDPTTCERDYTEAEVEFMNALDEYKRHSGRMFPTCSEVLEVIRSLGYAKLTAASAAACQVTTECSAVSAPADWCDSDAGCNNDQMDEEAVFESALVEEA